VDVSLILPCYNEAQIFRESVSRIVHTLEATKYSYEIIFVDDKSEDETAKLIRGTIKKNKHMRAVFHSRNMGRGSAVRDGLLEATGTVAGFIDIDCEVSPLYIPHMVDLIMKRKADVVIGRRFYRTNTQSIIREILSRGYRWLADRMVRTGGLDTETGYKFFNRKKILPVLKRTKHNGWFWDTEIMVRAKGAGFDIVEVPVLFLRRFDKTSTVRPFRDIADYLISLWRLRR